VSILEPENDAIQLLMTKLRDESTKGAEFRFYADRLLSFLAEMAIQELPNDEVVLQCFVDST
jgi:uracil phosphoribosyltransferase